jgi:hypothetical protein
MKEKPKFVNIGYYWKDETFEKIANLLHEYQDLFLTTFPNMNGIVGELGKIKILLKLDTKPVSWRLYKLNLEYKEKVKTDLERMIEASIIEPSAKSEWIIPMVFQDKKIWGIIVCIYLRKLNDSCLHDPFPTPFTEKVLENVGGQEEYSFIDGFLGYHQIKIVPEDRHNMTFMNEWGSYQYMVMSFSLKNAPAMFSRVVVATFKELFINFLKCI